MNHLVRFFTIACIVLCCESGHSQDQVIPTSLIQVMANPDKFDGKTVALYGFLRMGQEKHHGVQAVLYLHQEDAKHLLGINGISVIPSELMVKDQEKIDNMYVTLTGVLRAVHTTEGSYTVIVKNVRSCQRWSDPGRPIGLGEGK